MKDYEQELARELLILAYSLADELSPADWYGVRRLAEKLEVYNED